jgi:hypothetical protein
MKPVCLVLAVTLLPSFAVADQGLLGVSEDASGYDMVIDDHTPGARTVYIVHRFTEGSTGCEFAYVEDPGMTMVRVGGGTIGGMFALGDLDTGVAVAYQECKVGSFPVYRIDYQALGTSAACSFLRIVPSQMSVPPAIWLADCSTNATIRNYSAIAIVNPDGTCNPNPVAPSTWGRVKALYR